MDDPLQHLPEGAKHALDVISAATMVGALVQWLPALASLLTIVWTLLRIYETRTVQRLLGHER